MTPLVAPRGWQSTTESAREVWYTMLRSTVSYLDRFLEPVTEAFKGPNLSSIDPETGNKVELFNPRQDEWSNHFAFSGGLIVGLTPVGRATARLLNRNDSRRVELRLQWLSERG